MQANWSIGNSFLCKLSSIRSERTLLWLILIWKWTRITSRSSISRWLEPFNQASFLLRIPVIIYYKDKVKLAWDLSFPTLNLKGGKASKFWESLPSQKELQLSSLGNCRDGTWGSLPRLGLLQALRFMLRTNCVMQLLESWKELKEKPACLDAYHSIMVLLKI